MNVNDWVIDIPDCTSFAVQLSGGTDSAAVLYKLCEQINGTNIEIYLITGVEYERPTNEQAAKNITNVIKSYFPNVIFKDHLFFYFHNRRITGISKSQEFITAIDKFKQQYGFTHTFHGRTLNPDDENLIDGRELKRDQPINNSRTFHTPLQAVTKKFVKEFYEDRGLMDSIYPLTESCIGDAQNTNNFAMACKKCWWCREKFWAFGTYDKCVK